MSEINAASEHAKTNNNPKTSLLKARILTKQFLLDDSFSASKVALCREALESFTKAMSLVGNDKNSDVGKLVYAPDNCYENLPEKSKSYSLKSLTNKLEFQAFYGMKGNSNDTSAYA